MPTGTGIAAVARRASPTSGLACGEGVEAVGVALTAAVDEVLAHAGRRIVPVGVDAASQGPCSLGKLQSAVDTPPDPPDPLEAPPLPISVSPPAPPLEEAPSGELLCP